MENININNLNKNQLRKLENFNNQLVSNFPKLLKSSVISSQLDFDENVICQYYKELFLMFLKEDDLIILNYYSTLISHLSSIQKKDETKFINNWESKIFKHKKDIEELRNILFDWEELVFLKKRSVLISRTYKLHNKYLDLDKVLISERVITKINELIHFYLERFEKQLTMPSCSEAKFIWTGNKVDLFEIVRALKLSGRIKTQSGKSITFKEIADMFSFLTFENTTKSVTEKNLNDDVLKGYDKNKRALDNKFFLYDLNEILREDKEQRMDKR